MAVRFDLLLTLGVTTFAVAGCSMMPFGGGGRSTPSTPTPLAAAPMGTITGSPLPPPDATASVTPPGAVAPSGTMPPAPSGLAALDPNLQTSAPPQTQLPVGNDQMGRTDLLGGWTINAAGGSCQLFMTLTTWAGGYRASTRGCASPPLQTVSAWNMDGNQVQLLNDTGTTVARLYPSSKTQLSGQTEGGGPITVSR